MPQKNVCKTVEGRRHYIIPLTNDPATVNKILLTIIYKEGCTPIKRTLCVEHITALHILEMISFIYAEIDIKLNGHTRTVS